MNHLYKINFKKTLSTYSIEKSKNLTEFFKKTITFEILLLHNKHSSMQQ